jgi:exodeoxyribonuclease-5
MVVPLLLCQADHPNSKAHLVIWSPQQDKALVKASRWHSLRDQPYFVLAGFAGTGKTTLAKHLVAEWSGTVLVAAYTGKAAHVLRKHGLPTASTIHQLIYTPRDKCDAKLRELERKLATKLKQGKDQEALALEKAIFKERANLRRPEFTLNSDSPLQDASLLIIDEYSMVDEQVGRDLLSFQCPILALGDPGQLPPVQGRRFFTGKPDVLLTEIHRQAADNPIIRLSRDVREGKSLVPGHYGRSNVLSMLKISPGDLNELMLGADQILVGTNKTRTSYNRVMRKLLGRESSYPETGDKLVCLRNSHLEGLLNGQIWNVRKSEVASCITLHLEDDDGARTTCVAHRDYFDGDPDKISVAERKQANEFDFGYVLTVHKAQGSQWNDVVLVDEWRGSNRTQWLYTGITRAAKTITVLQ